MKCYENKSMSVDLKAINIERERVLFAELRRADLNFTEIFGQISLDNGKIDFLLESALRTDFSNHFTEIVAMMKN